MLIRTMTMAALASAMLCGTSIAARIPGLSPGPVELKSAGPISFAGSGVLLVGDAKAATVYAIDTEDERVESDRPLQIDNLSKQIAEELGVAPDAIAIADLAVNPETGNAFLSISAGESNQAMLVRVAQDASVSVIDLNKVDHAKKVLPNPPEDRVNREGRRPRNPRDEAITDVAFFDGKVLVSGLSAGDSPSSVIEFPFPFAENSVVSNVEIFHAAHGRVEEPAIRAFVPFTVGGEPSLLAGFTCTPLVKFPIDQLRGSNEKVRGTTVAELGNRNRPLDMFVYEKDGKPYVLMSNTARGMMKISTEDLESNPGLTERVGGGGTAGQPYESIESLASVTRMDKLSDTQAVVIMTGDDGIRSLKVIDLP